MAEVKLVVKQIDQGSKGISNTAKRLEGLLDVAQKSAVAVAAAGATFKQAFDLSREGANLNQLTKSFELMNAQVFQAPDLLNQMSEAARGTIKETDLMAGLLKLTAGASDELAGRLAQASPQLIEIAKASNKLNPALGDTAFLYDSIATGIKRASPLILDNLGIVVKVGEANERYAEQLGKTVEQLSAEEKQIALLNEVLRSGDQLIKQVGGNVDSQADAWARLEVIIGENTDAFKQFLANGLLPVVSAMAGDYGTATANVINSNIEQAESMEDLIAAGQRMQATYEDVGRAGLIVTGASEEFNEGVRQNILAISAASGSAKELHENLIAVFGEDAQRLFQIGMISTRGVTVSLEEMEEVLGQNVVRYDELSDKQIQAQNATSGLDAQTRQLTEGLERADMVLLQNAMSAQELINADRELARAFEELDNAAGQYFVEAVEGDLTQANLNQRIFEAAEAAGASATELAILGGALGLYSDEAVEAALKTAIIQAEIDRLAESYAQGDLTVGQMTAQLNNFIAGLDETSGSLSHAGQEIDALVDKMNNMPDGHVFRVRIEQDGAMPALPSGPAGKNAVAANALGGFLRPGEVSQVGEFNLPELFTQGGKLFMIPGDQGQVFSNSQSRGMMGGNTTLNAPITINVQGSGDPQAISAAVQDALLRSMRTVGVQ